MPNDSLAAMAERDAKRDIRVDEGFSLSPGRKRQSVEQRLLARLRRYPGSPRSQLRLPGMRANDVRQALAKLISLKLVRVDINADDSFVVRRYFAVDATNGKVAPSE